MHCRGNPFKFYDPNMNSGESAIWVFAVWRCAIMLNVSNWEEYVCESNSVHLDASHDRIYYAFSEPSTGVFGCHFHNNVYIIWIAISNLRTTPNAVVNVMTVHSTVLCRYAWSYSFSDFSYFLVHTNVHCGNNISNLNRDILCEI